jgi:hypothetical protein
LQRVFPLQVLVLLDLAIWAVAGADDGKQLISVMPFERAKRNGFGSKNYTTNGVGMGHHTETFHERFSAYVGQLYPARRERHVGKQCRIEIYPRSAAGFQKSSMIFMVCPVMRTRRPVR